MKVGILFTSHPVPDSEVYPHHAIHERVTREVLEAEQLGFDSAWMKATRYSRSRCSSRIRRSTWARAPRVRCVLLRSTALA